MSYVLLIIGFVFLVKGADIFVSGSSAIAEFFKIPTFIIGMTIVAFGTSMPEAAISVTAAVQGANGIAVGNALGSNLFNLMVVLGASAIIKECPVSAETLRFEYPLSVLAAALLFIMGGGTGIGSSVISRADGLILLALFALFMVVTVRKALRSHKKEQMPDYYEGGDIEIGGACIMEAGGELICEERDLEDCEDESMSILRAVIYSALGIAGIIIGGNLVVNSAVVIAEAFGIDEVLIGLTIVALGTSLPELVIGMVAAAKGETDIAVGNVIGSNIFNLLLVLGLSTAIQPIAVTLPSIYDMIILIAVSLFILIPLVRKQALTRGWGAALLVMYGGYLAYIIMRTA